MAEARAAGYPEIEGTGAARIAKEAGLPIARADQAFLFSKEGHLQVVWLDGDGNS